MGKYSLIIYITLAVVVLLLISRSSNNKSHRHRHRRLRVRSNFTFAAPGDHHHLHDRVAAAAFDPLVAEIERKREDKEWEHHYMQAHHPESTHSTSSESTEPEWEDFMNAEDYLNDEEKFNVTNRLVVLFPNIDVDPPDGFVSTSELILWNLKQSQKEVMHRTEREMEVHDKNKDGFVSLAEYEPPSWISSSGEFWFIAFVFKQCVYFDLGIFRISHFRCWDYYNYDFKCIRNYTIWYRAKAVSLCSFRWVLLLACLDLILHWWRKGVLLPRRKRLKRHYKFISHAISVTCWVFILCFCNNIQDKACLIIVSAITGNLATLGACWVFVELDLDQVQKTDFVTSKAHELLGLIWFSPTIQIITHLDMIWAGGKRIILMHQMQMVMAGWISQSSMSKFLSGWGLIFQEDINLFFWDCSLSATQPDSYPFLL